MGKKHILVTAMVGLAMMLIAAGIYAAAPEIIPMQNEKYEEHTKGIVQFNHKKHSEDYAKDYPKVYKDGCGECHHDDKGQPLTDLGPDDPVQGCIECHSIPGEVPKEKKKEWREKKVKRSEQKKLELEYHAEAIHDNCRDCHREFNKEYKPKKAPTTCTTCHPKTD
jgi:hypothetical protein